MLFAQKEPFTILKKKNKYAGQPKYVRELVVPHPALIDRPGLDKLTLRAAQ